MSSETDTVTVRLPKCDRQGLEELADDLGESTHGAHKRLIRWSLDHLGYADGDPMAMDNTTIQQSSAELARFAAYSAVSVLAIHTSTSASVGVWAFVLVLLAVLLLGIEKAEPRLTEEIEERWDW